MAKSPVSIIYDSGGTEKATAGNPLRTDPVGTTAQPVTDNGGSLTVDGSVAVSNFPAVQPVSDNGGSLTVDGTVGISGTVPVSGPLTDSQLRASPVPVSGTVTANAGTGPWPVTDNGGSLTVDGPLTDAQLRATAVPVSMAAGGYGGQVEGRAADGAAPIGYPVLIGGSDGSLAQTLLTDSLGRLVVATAGAAGTTKGFALGTMVTTAITDVPVRSTTYTEPSA